ncbi:hypothetical protein LL965_07370 [Xanthomonas cassavae CFBP 4642]|uniref:Uncharacterized protein n=1 Tax=Xanthomonas cassavae CFBP 4642 TaxID=1219375 RepID=A0ABS8HFK0_9XANT|nr:hypothetical protein [Xanthomonas cassavae]MCC4619920.1 hypothetical protein [Xanthomonas cassavae CFBP 4642]
MHDYPLVISSLSRSITQNEHPVRLEIYRGPDTDWTLEVVDEFNNSTVWEDLFATDQAAFDEALRTIRGEGIQPLVGQPGHARSWGGRLRFIHVEPLRRSA